MLAGAQWPQDRLGLFVSQSGWIAVLGPSEGRATMRRSTGATLACGLFLLSNLPAAAQSTPNPAMNAPDQLAWQFFVQVNTSAGGGNALFETWASDTDTFKPNPQFPTTAAPLALRQPAVPAAGRLALQRSGRLFPAIPPGQGVLEESRRNRESSTSSCRIICSRFPVCARRSATPLRFRSPRWR